MIYCNAGKHFVQDSDVHSSGMCFACKRVSNWAVSKSRQKAANVVFEISVAGYWKASFYNHSYIGDVIATGRSHNLYNLSDGEIVGLSQQFVLESLKHAYVPDAELVLEGSLKRFYISLPLNQHQTEMTKILRYSKSLDRLPSQKVKSGGVWSFWCPKVDEHDPLLLHYEIANIHWYDYDTWQPVSLEVHYSPVELLPIFKTHRFIWQTVVGRYQLYFDVVRNEKYTGTYILDFLFG